MELAAIHPIVRHKAVRKHEPQHAAWYRESVESKEHRVRWIIGSVIALVVFLIVYLGSAVTSLTRLVAAVQAGDGAAVMAQTDTQELSRSLTGQIVGAYLDRIGAKRTVSSRERFIANTYGASIADAMVSKMLTADKLTAILRTGKFEGAEKIPAFTGVASLGQLQTSDILGLMGRLRFVQPTLLSIRVSDTTEPDSYTAIALRYGDFEWKLAGINLPRKVVEDLAASLPVK
ncbi:MAG: DUF2939 domain-containing protein [Proteobacteria bacterium]|nr:DUF2939 domain-containing protein [Pseudomonadota bacterium]